MSDMYKEALIGNYRYEYRGIWNTEDLFKMAPEDLAGIFQALTHERKKTEGDSLLKIRSSETDTLDRKIAIVKDIFETLQAKKLAKQDQAKKRLRRQELLELKHKRETDELASLSSEQLDKLLEELEED